MENIVPLPERTYAQINENRRRLLHEAYFSYPEYIYCDPEKFNWHTSAGRINIFDIFYLGDCNYIDLIGGSTEIHRKPEFFMLTPRGADLMEIPNKLDERFPVERDKELFQK
jgi:hypothetical protein